MQRLDADAFLKPKRAQPVAFTWRHGSPVDRTHGRDFVQRELVELHGAYLQPIRNNIKKDSSFGGVAEPANEA